MENKNKSRVTVRLMGGLGNQLFQYALGRAVEIACGAEVSFDASAIALKNNRRYMLDRFNTVVHLSTETPAQTLLSRITSLFGGMVFIREKHLRYMPDLFARISRDSSFYLDGYWQTEEYFKNIREQLLAEITLRAPFSDNAQNIARTISSFPSVALHVRRGDYVTNADTRAAHGVCDIEYYHAAIKTMLEKVPGAHFFVFSDDITWARECLGLDPARTTYVSGTGLLDEEELMLMSACAHTIIANSSFSWWGAWLNKNIEKIVIAPRAWFKHSRNNTDHLIPASWIRL